MSDIDAVCFDLDSTLCVSNQSDGDVHAAVFDRAGIDPLFSPEDVRAVDSADVETAETDAEFYANLYRATVANCSTARDVDPSLLDELGEITAEVVDQTDVSFRPGAEEMLASARDRYDVGLITNGGKETQRAKLETLGIADAFDVAVYCDPTAGIDPKPATEPFRRALAGLTASAATTLYVGNDHSADVVGAHAAGLQSAWLPLDRPTGTTPSAPEPTPTYRLESPADLSTIL
ncbi:HAD family hydrolase [Halovivax limisalsi]|uniref:HAD family hydrolase n=1 Tax=Halovivax limisalsi TaxID=1453760 RepID=UPI001FFD8E3D|nr:HAD family hydrolase [Halovivax limisalsi]